MLNEDLIYDVAVIGLGSAGLASTYELSKCGLSVIGLEQFQFDHDLGSHTGFTRLIRKAYYEHPSYVPLLQKAYAGWKSLEEEFGEQIYFPTGLLYQGSKNHEFIAGVKESARLYEIDLVEKERGEGNAILLEPDAGYIDTRMALRAFRILSEKLGANLNFNSKVDGWDYSHEGFTIRVTGLEVKARKIVIASGAWLKESLIHRLKNDQQSLRESLSVTEQWIGWFESTASEKIDSTCWGLVEEGVEGLLYGFPLVHHLPDPYNKLYKVAIHHPARKIDPEMKSANDFQEEEANKLTERLNRNFPGKYGKLRAMQSCLYTNTPDGHFLLGSLPENNRIVIAGGFSGHGFKFLPAIGAITTSIIKGSLPGFDIDFLAPARFINYARSGKYPRKP